MEEVDKIRKIMLDECKAEKCDLSTILPSGRRGLSGSFPRGKIYILFPLILGLALGFVRRSLG